MRLKGEAIDVIYLDYSEASDLVLHSILISGLEELSILNCSLNTVLLFKKECKCQKTAPEVWLSAFQHRSGLPQMEGHYSPQGL